MALKEQDKMFIKMSEFETFGEVNICTKSSLKRCLSCTDCSPSTIWFLRVFSPIAAAVLEAARKGWEGRSPVWRRQALEFVPSFEYEII